MRLVRVRWAALGAFLLWLAAVLAVFYAVQKPLQVRHAVAMVSTLGELARAAFTWAVGWSWGRRGVRWLVGASCPEGFVHAAGLALGLGGLALLNLLLGLAGGLSPGATWALAAVLALLPGWDVAELARRGLVGEGPWRGWRVWLRGRPRAQRLLMLYVGLAFGGALLLALAPPLGWDSLFYHLTGPKWYLENGRIAPLPVDLPHLHYPSLVEMLFLWEMRLGGERAAVLVHWGYGLLLAAAVVGLAWRHLGRDAAMWALGLFASMPMVVTLASWAYTDLALATYLVLALWAWLLWRERPAWGTLMLGGLFAGMALATKYTAAPGVLAVGAVLTLWGWRRPRCTVKALGAFAAGTLLAAGPWYLKTWAFTGNPVYPFLFGGAGWDAWRAWWYAEPGTGIGADLLELLLLPVTVTLGIRDVNYYDGRMGPLFLAFLPLVVWAVARARARPSALAPLLVVSGAQVLAWTAGVIWAQALFQSRLLLPGLAMLCPVYGWALAQLPLPALPGGFNLRRFLGVVVGLALLWNGVEQGLDLVARGPVGVLVGQEGRDGYLLRNLGSHYAAMEVLGEATPPGARVIFFWEPRSYYSRRACQPDAILDQWPRLVRDYGRPEAIATALRAQGWTHLLWHQAGAAFVQRAGRAGTEGVWEVWGGMQACCLHPIWVSEDGTYVLYALDAGE